MFRIFIDGEVASPTYHNRIEAWWKYVEILVEYRCLPGWETVQWAQDAWYLGSLFRGKTDDIILNGINLKVVE